MDFLSLLQQTQCEFESLKGKRIGSQVYVHSSQISKELMTRIRDLMQPDEAREHRISAEDMIIRLDLPRARIAMLHYPNFFEAAHPALCCSTLVDAGAGKVSRRMYAASGNRPILHRKELLLASSHPSRDGFAALTAEEERYGLFGEPRRIGWESHWKALLKRKKIEIKDHKVYDLVD